MQKLGTGILGTIGAFLAAHWLLILIVLVAILILAVLIIVIATRKKTPEASAASTAPAAPAAAPAVDTYTLRTAWLRFESRLPGSYRRSLLNFEHFVVMGAPASGKSRVIDAYSDWKQQTREFPTHQADDPDLPVYSAPTSSSWSSRRRSSTIRPRPPTRP
jgi:type VI protein secretion system component VasK